MDRAHVADPDTYDEALGPSESHYGFAAEDAKFYDQVEPPAQKPQMDGDVYDEVLPPSVTMRSHPAPVATEEKRRNTLWLAPKAPLAAAGPPRTSMPPAQAPLPPPRRNSSASLDALPEYEQPITLPRRPQTTVPPSPSSTTVGPVLTPVLPDSVPELAFPMPLPKLSAVKVDKKIDQVDADKMLHKSKTEGAFVLRASRSHPGSYVLCLYFGGNVLHYPVEACAPPHDGMFVVLCDPLERRRFRNLAEVVVFYSATASGLATRLTKRIK